MRPIVAALFILLSITGLVPVSGAWAADPAERLADPVLEARAEALSRQLRCLVCQNQSIEDSDADLARDLRRLVREHIVAGDDDGAIKTFLVERYGEFVLLKPRFSGAGLVLWILPVVLLVLTAGGLVMVQRRRRSAVSTVDEFALTAEEEERLARLLDEQDRRLEG
jgi:cytochrome c-type biogenesis protein CcmH